MAALLPLAAAAQTVILPAPSGAVIRGADRSGRWIAVWGDRCLLTASPEWKWTVVRGPAGPGFGEGGALADVDEDGRIDVIVQEEHGALVWFQAPHWTRRVIERSVEAADVRFATIAGRRGVVLIHHGGQVRFYQAPRPGESAWPSRDLYSFYSASRQGGLLVADVDGDGHDDLITGNYWMRNPGEFDLPWRLFAIKLWAEGPLSALTQFALLANGDVAAAQRSLSPGRLALYRKPRDPRQLWEQKILATDLDLPRTVLAGDVNGDGREEIVVAESGPKGRVFVFEGGLRRQAVSGIPMVSGWLDRGELVGVAQPGVLRIPVMRTRR